MVTAKQRHCAQTKKMMLYGDNMIYQKKYFQCNHQTQQVVALVNNEETKKNDKKYQSRMVKLKQHNGSGRKKHTVIGSPEVTTRTKNLKINGMA